MKSNSEISEILMNTKENTDFEVRSLDKENFNNIEENQPMWHLLKYLLMGVLFGVVVIKSQVISWFRIQEMFRLQSFHMYGVIGSAVAVGMISVFLIRKLKLKTISGELIVFHSRKFNKGQIYGGLMFGLGWAVTGACPGPLFAQIGTGYSIVLVTLLSAIA